MKDKVNEIFGLLLVGGRSSRMKSDKARIRYHAQTQVEHAYDLLTQCIENVFVSVNNQQVQMKPFVHFPCLPDVYDDIGPLGGILTAMSFRPEVAWLVLACDMPLVSRATIDLLIDERDAEFEATLYKNRKSLPEPLCAIYEPSVFPALMAARESGIFCPRKILAHHRTKMIALSRSDELLNINTISQRAGLQKRLRSEGRDIQARS